MTRKMLTSQEKMRAIFMEEIVRNQKPMKQGKMATRYSPSVILWSRQALAPSFAAQDEDGHGCGEAEYVGRIALQVDGCRRRLVMLYG
jgi:hypothetical protein